MFEKTRLTISKISKIYSNLTVANEAYLETLEENGLNPFFSDHINKLEEISEIFKLMGSKEKFKEFYKELLDGATKPQLIKALKFGFSKKDFQIIDLKSLERVERADRLGILQSLKNNPAVVEKLFEWADEKEVSDSQLSKMLDGTTAEQFVLCQFHG